MLSRIKIVSALIAGTFMMSSAATAAPILFCSSGVDGMFGANGCLSGTAGGNGQNPVIYFDAAYSNAGGGDDEAAVEAALAAVTGLSVDLTLYGKTDDNPELFETTGVAGSTDGFWGTVSGALIDYITVKAANSYVLYDVGGIASGVWTTDGIFNNGGEQPGVSHISFWTTDTTPVPLPAAGWMLIAAVGGLGAMRRRQK